LGMGHPAKHRAESPKNVYTRSDFRSQPTFPLYPLVPTIFTHHCEHPGAFAASLYSPSRSHFVQRPRTREMPEKITPRTQDYPQWYLDVVKNAGLADNSDVRGCMVIKPTGFALWEKMQKALDRLFKDTGHVNAYFPLFIPMSYLAKEEEMAEGFAKEC